MFSQCIDLKTEAIEDVCTHLQICKQNAPLQLLESCPVLLIRVYMPFEASEVNGCHKR